MLLAPAAAVEYLLCLKQVVWSGYRPLPFLFARSQTPGTMHGTAPTTVCRGHCVVATVEKGR